MTKQEALQLFKDNVNVQALKATFPDIGFAITALEDGQLELTIRLQAADDHEAIDLVADVDAIDNLTFNDIPAGRARNTTVLSTLKKKQKRELKRKVIPAIVKRIIAWLPEKISAREIAKELSRQEDLL